MNPRIRGVLHKLGIVPTRADLLAHIQRLEIRVAQREAERNEAHQRIKAERGLRHDAVNRAEQLAATIRRLEAAIERLRDTEPERREGCVKIRFHRREEANYFLHKLAENNREPDDAFHVYACPICPRSPATGNRFLHITHSTSGYKNASIRRANEASRTARDNGSLLGQRVDPAVVAQLAKVRKALAETANS